MTIVLGGCTCGQPFLAIGAPPLCPIHGRIWFGCTAAGSAIREYAMKLPDPVTPTAPETSCDCNEYVVLPAHDYTVDTQAYYAYSLAEAEETKKRLQAETNREWRIFSR